MLNLDVTYLAVRLETALEVIQDITADQANQTQTTLRYAIKSYFENSILVTRYNNKIYRVKRVAFNKNPGTIFTKTITDEATGRKKFIK